MKSGGSATQASISRWSWLERTYTTPTVHQGMVLLGGENRGLHGIRPVREGGSWAARKVWSQKKVALDMASGVMNGDLFYGLSHYGRGRIFCLDTKSGDVRWQGPGRTGQNAAFLSAPLAVGLNKSGPA